MTTREKVTEHWCDIVRAVFGAEDSLRDKLKAILADDTLTYEEKRDRYVRTVAEEIISRASDEELEKVYGGE